MNNQYFTLRESIDSKVIGSEFPQIQTFANKYDKNASDSLYRIPWFGIPDFTPNLDGPKLQYRAKKTDYLSCGMFHRGWVFNEKVKKIFEKYNFIKHKYFPMKIYSKKEILTDYYALISEFDILQYIDFEKTEFYAFHNHTQQLCEKVNIKDGEHYEQMYDEVINRTERMYEYNLKHKLPIYLKPNFPRELDFFTMYIFITDPIISEGLKLELEAENVTGIEYRELTQEKVVFL
jgi:hypothetical protein